ncbi:MAG: SNF2-related protein [Enterobacterales bacterium]|nr:SNF2-related protein [Enterobacterales bacterium]
MSKQFSVGQRWLSENEPELGLGIIERVDHRLVAVFYPATDDQRTYASDSAPLIRVEHEVGNQIETLDGHILSIKEVVQHNGTLVYMVQDPQDTNKILPLPETQISHHLKLEQATDRLFSGQLDSMKWFQLRFAAMQAKQNQQSSPIIGLQGPRVDLIGHQLHIAHEVGSRFAPRVLLSDEVGLGKTIEAGMIIHQQLISHRAQRVLIVVPQSLVHQWFVEMIRRFNLHFSIFDQSRIDSINQIDFEQLEQAGMTNLDDFKDIEMENPFLSEQLILCSTEFMAACPIEQMVEAEWDLLIVDEAHHLQWTQQKPAMSTFVLKELPVKRQVCYYYQPLQSSSDKKAISHV